MSLGKRHIGRRVAGVGLGVALLVLGLQAPAYAAPPTISAVSPTSGARATAAGGCVVVVKGTNFNNPNVTNVTFGAAGASFTRQSATELWTTVPAAAPLGLTTITVDNGSPPAAVFGFTVTDPAVSGGGCVPTVTSFTPTCGSNSAGTVVTITGTNLLKKDDATGGDVQFAPYPGLPGGASTHSNVVSESPTTLAVLVPGYAADGPIRVSTFSNTIGIGAALGATPFLVPPPDCPPVSGNEHARSVTLSLKKHLVAKGVVSSTEDPAFTDCVASVPVKIQRKTSSGWKNVGSTTTMDTGSYKKSIKDKPGKYRALAPAVALGTPVTDNCLQAKSPKVTHKH